MSDSMVVGTVLACGAGTFLIRYLPLLLHARLSGAKRPSARMRRALDAIGPSAIVALLVVALSTIVAGPTLWKDVVSVFAGLLGVAVGKRVTGEIAWGTLMGVLSYGLGLWLMGAV